jgi:hypothetical protein
VTLTDFLLERIAEDETVARGAYRDSVDDAGICHETWTEASTAVMWGDVTAISGLEPDYLATHIARHDPARVLAECEAKRGAIEAAWRDHMQIESEWGMCQTREQMSAKSDNPEVLHWLALPYADHSDYDASWRP